MSEELNVLTKVCESLNKIGVDYMITGSIAANFYTVPRMTRDIDIIIELNIDKVSQIYKAFQDEFYIDEEMVIEEVRRNGIFNIIHNQTLVKVDFIILKDTPYRNLELNRRRSITIEDVTAYIVSPEDLIISKLIWAKDSHSEIQLNDVRNILEDVKSMDIEYLEKWVNELGIGAIYKEVS